VLATTEVWLFEDQSSLTCFRPTQVLDTKAIHQTTTAVALGYGIVVVGDSSVAVATGTEAIVKTRDWGSKYLLSDVAFVPNTKVSHSRNFALLAYLCLDNPCLLITSTSVL
jgi:hypothetical protein